MKALGHSSYLAACQTLIIATCCDSKVNVSWRDTQANSEGGKFAQTKPFISSVISSTAPAVPVPFSMALHKAHSLSWAADGPSGQSSDIQTSKKKNGAFFPPFLPMKSPLIILFLCLKFLLNFGHYGSSTFCCHGRTHSLCLARWRCKQGFTECSWVPHFLTRSSKKYTEQKITEKIPVKVWCKKKITAK